MVGGLSVSTFLTLLVVPSAYLFLNTGAERLSKWVTGKNPRTVGSGASVSATGPLETAGG